MGINTIGDLLKLSQENLVEIFGKVGVEIYLRIRGIDERPVETMREIKSIGKEKHWKKIQKIKTFASLCEIIFRHNIRRIV